jgi:hypothetical protein
MVSALGNKSLTDIKMKSDGTTYFLQTLAYNSLAVGVATLIPETAYSGNKECENIPMSIKSFGDERF